MSSLSNLIADAKRMDPQLAPTVDEVPGVLGALVVHVTEALGSLAESGAKELPALADKALGIAPAEPAAPAAPPGGPAQAELEGLESTLEQLRAAGADAAATAGVEALIVQKRGQVQTPVAGAPGSGVTATGATP